LNKEIWDNQLNFNNTFFKDNLLELSSLSVEDKTKWSKEFVLNIEQELHSIIKCFPKWKMKNINDEYNSNIDPNYKEKFIDCFKYTLGLAQILGISYDEIIEEYYKKSEVVEQRYNQNKNIESLKNSQVIVFDIDGVINNYPYCFIDWVNDRFNQTFKTFEELKSTIEYQSYKEQYRLSGAKIIQPINVDTVETINKLYDNGEKIVLYTVRPVKKYKRIYYDTITWLKRNNIKYNAIFFSDYSKEDFKNLGLNIKCFIDDDLNNAILFSKEHKTFLLNNEFNQTNKEYNFERISKVSEIMEKL